MECTRKSPSGRFCSPTINENKARVPIKQVLSEASITAGVTIATANYIRSNVCIYVCVWVFVCNN